MIFQKVSTTVVLCLAILSFVLADENNSEEGPVIAALNYNFAKYATWPDDGTEITFCFLSESYKTSFAELQTKKINNKKLLVQLVSDIDQALLCHIIYIDSGQRDILKRLFVGLKNKPVLTVSDMPGFLNQGGMIELFKSKGKFQFNINHSRIKAVDLKMSTQVLKLAREVK